MASENSFSLDFQWSVFNVLQIEDLRMSLARMEKEHSRREEMLKQENSDLQMVNIILVTNMSHAHVYGWCCIMSVQLETSVSTIIW